MKKGVKFLLGIVVIIILVEVIFVAVNYIKNEDYSNEGNGITEQNNNEVAQNTSWKYSDLEELPKDYSSEQAIIDGCLIISNNNKIYNKSILDEFLHNTSANYTEQKKPSKIRIIQ